MNMCRLSDHIFVRASALCLCTLIQKVGKLPRMIKSSTKTPVRCRSAGQVRSRNTEVRQVINRGIKFFCIQCPGPGFTTHRKRRPYGLAAALPASPKGHWAYRRWQTPCC